MECLKPTPWESRNLGLESFVISQDFYLQPDEQQLVAEINRHTKESGQIFIYARVEKKDFSVNPLLERLGFVFVEQTLEPYTLFEKNQVLKQFRINRSDFLPKRYDPANVSVIRLDRGDKERCNNLFKIAKESFMDDRFHLDQECDANTADRRFVYWTQDLLADPDVVFYVAMHKEEMAGFMACKANHLILAGFSKKYVGGGLGDCLWMSVLEDMKKNGMSQAHTLISANNVSVLNLYARLDFKFRNPAVTFHYWGKAPK